MSRLTPRIICKIMKLKTIENRPWKPSEELRRLGTKKSKLWLRKRKSFKKLTLKEKTKLKSN